MGCIQSAGQQFENSWKKSWWVSIGQCVTPVLFKRKYLGEDKDGYTVFHQMTQQTLTGGSIILRGTCTKTVVFDSLCNKTSNLFLLKPSVFASSVWLWCSISGHSGADGAGSGSLRRESGMRWCLAPARVPQRAGHHALFHWGHAIRPGGLHHAEALAQDRQPQLDLQHFQKSGVVIWVKGGPCLYPNLGP